MDVKNGTEAT
jgi:hypothetical protein